MKIYVYTAISFLIGVFLGLGMAAYAVVDSIEKQGVFESSHILCANIADIAEEVE